MNQNKTVPILLSIIAVLFVSILVILAIYLPKNQSVPVKIDVTLTPTVVPTITVAPTTTSTSSIPSDWKTYDNKTLNFKFSYPPEFGDIKFSIDQGETGRSFGGSFSKNKSLSFGGISTDYSQGRSGMFSDFSGYENNNGVITFHGTKMYNKSWPIDKNLIYEIFKNKNGVEIVIVKGKNGGDAGWPIEGTPGEGNLGGIINLPNTEFPGIAFQVDASYGLSNFKDMLSTFKFTN